MSLIDIKIPNSASDVVAVFDQNFNQVFVNARPMKAEVREHSKVMQHPVETGITITDHRIIEPTTINLFVIAGGGSLRDIYSEIRQLFGKATLLIVQTRTNNYENMLIEEMPHEEGIDMYDAVPIRVRLKEVQFVQAQFDVLPAKQVANPANASTVDRGQLNPTNDLLLGQQGVAKTEEVKGSWIWRHTH